MSDDPKQWQVSDFLKDGGTVTLSWHEESSSIQIEAVGCGKRAIRLCDNYIPPGWDIIPRDLLGRDIGMCVSALMDYQPTQIEECDHEWEVINTSPDSVHDHYQIGFLRCKYCGKEREYEPPSFPDGVI